MIQDVAVKMNPKTLSEYMATNREARALAANASFRKEWLARQGLSQFQITEARDFIRFVRSTMGPPAAVETVKTLDEWFRMRKSQLLIGRSLKHYLSQPTSKGVYHIEEYNDSMLNVKTIQRWTGFTMPHPRKYQDYVIALTDDDVKLQVYRDNDDDSDTMTLVRSIELEIDPTVLLYRIQGDSPDLSAGEFWAREFKQQHEEDVKYALKPNPPEE